MKLFTLAVRFISILVLASACSKSEYDIVIRGGTLYDGSGGPAVVADLAINGDRITNIGDPDGHIWSNSLN